MYMMWYDDSPKHTQEDKIRAAAEAYSKHFNGVRPNLALVHPSEVVEMPELTVRGVATVAKNNVWVGRE